MSKATKPATAQAPAENAAADQPGKGKKKPVLIILILLLVLGGGAAVLLLWMNQPKHTSSISGNEKAEQEALSKAQAKFVDLGTFTANLVREDGDRYLQVAISLKITDPKLEDKIKANSPEILHYVNMVLQSKRPSDLYNLEGKERLAEQIKGQVEYVLGLRKNAPSIEAGQTGGEPAGSRKTKTDIAEVLFTSFIIQ